ncbi:UNVERIFIED_CONTAM: DNA damage-binding protein 1 [Siphonaria sp. JEL0065]|nr:DNA damage-binding protein 1 [Siphonaria sp. JEL0065]
MVAGFSTLTVEGASPSTFRNLFVVGTAIRSDSPDEYEDEPKAGRVVVLQTNQETKKLEILSAVETKGCVYAVAELKGGAIVSTIGSKVQVFQFDVDEEVLVPVCHKYGFIQAIYLSVYGDFIAVGDLMKSVTLLEYKRPSADEDKKGEDEPMGRGGPGTLVEVARDHLPAWTTSVHTINSDMVVVGELGNNLYTLRRQTEVQLEDEKKRLEIAGCFHLGDYANRIRFGSLAMNTGSEQANTLRDSAMLYCTTNGQFGSILLLDADKFRILNGVQANLAKHVTPVGGFDHTEWRTFASERRRVESMGYIDGDFVQQFTQLTENEMASVFNGEKNGNVKVEAESVDAVLALLEEIALLS